MRSVRQKISFLKQTMSALAESLIVQVMLLTS